MINTDTREENLEVEYTTLDAALLSKMFLAGAKNLGDSVVTTLDMELQQAAYAALGDRRGAVIAMEPDTGKKASKKGKPGLISKPATRKINMNTALLSIPTVRPTYISSR